MLLSWIFLHLLQVFIYARSYTNHHHSVPLLHKSSSLSSSLISTKKQLFSHNEQLIVGQYSISSTPPYLLLSDIGISCTSSSAISISILSFVTPVSVLLIPSVLGLYSFISILFRAISFLSYELLILFPKAVLSCRSIAFIYL